MGIVRFLGPCAAQILCDKRRAICRGCQRRGQKSRAFFASKGVKSMDDLSNAVADQTWAAAVLDQLENPKLRTRLKQSIDSFCDEDQDAHGSVGFGA